MTDEIFLLSIKEYEKYKEYIPCKNCNFFEKEDGIDYMWCTYFEHYTDPEDYCSHAEKRENRTKKTS